jgi:hypothetical protein
VGSALWRRETKPVPFDAARPQQADELQPPVDAEAAVDVPDISSHRVGRESQRRGDAGLVQPTVEQIHDPLQMRRQRLSIIPLVKNLFGHNVSLNRWMKIYIFIPPSIPPKLGNNTFQKLSIDFA